MQKTTRLVMLACIAALSLLGPAAALGQGAPRVSPGSDGDTWGERTPPKGYVKSKEPKKSKSTYNWIQMGYGSLVILAMAGFVVYLIRRNNREKTGESRPFDIATRE